MKRIGLIGENSIEYVEKLLDIWNSNACAVLIDWRTPENTVVKLLQEANVQSCFIDTTILSKYENLYNFKKIAIRSYESNLQQLPCKLPCNLYNKYIPNYSSEEAVILYSSGTTGICKGVILSHYAISTNADAIIGYTKLNNSDCIYLPKTISHASSLTGELLVGLKTGATIVIAKTIVPPRYILRNIEFFNVTFISFNPTMFGLFISEYIKKPIDVSNMQVCVCGAIFNKSLFETAKKALPTLNFYNAYGLTEAGPRVTAQTKQHGHGNSAGKPIGNVQVVIVNSLGETLLRNEIGMIHVHSPSVFKGYISGSRRKSYYKDWLNTGDIGFWDEYGELNIVGRCDEIINIDAHKIYPATIEEQLLSISGIYSCCVTSVNLNGRTTLGCLYSSETDLNDIIRTTLRKILISYEIPKYIIRSNDLPKTRTGKISIKEAQKIITEHYKANNGRG